MTASQPTTLLINRLTDRLRENTGAKSSSELLDVLMALGTSAVREVGHTELTPDTLLEARELIDALEETIETGQHVELPLRGWRVVVEVSGPPAYAVDRPDDAPLVDDVTIYRHAGALSEVLA